MPIRGSFQTGIWMFHCRVNDHITGGMTARYEVLEK
jgi:FtsP/CotA-like multicopper oxidase with cupredoxin domain